MTATATLSRTATTASKTTPQQAAAKRAAREAEAHSAQRAARKAAIRAAAARNNKKRFPLEPLMALLVRDLGSNVAGQRRLKVSGSSLIHARDNDLSWAKADEWAVRAGYHPVEVWGRDWFDSYDLTGFNEADGSDDLRDKRTGPTPLDEVAVLALTEAAQTAASRKTAREAAIAAADEGPSDEELHSSEIAEDVARANSFG